jgi:hypothetical protein
VGIEVLVLGVISALRPATSQAAVFALLKAPSARRSLLAFSFAGIVVSVAIGLALVLVLGGTVPRRGRSTFSSVLDLIAGVAALSFAIGVRRGQLTRPRVPAGRRRGSGISDRLRHPSALTAAAAGVVTHVPGLIYLVALNSIAAEQPTAAAALAAVAVYNVLWFALPLAALALAIRSPRTANLYLDRLTAYARSHQDAILVLIFGGLGVYLTVTGIVSLT